MAVTTSDPASLASENCRLQAQLSQHLQLKENTDKLIAMLEFNNEHNKNKEEIIKKVKNMEVSNQLLNDRIYELEKQLEAKDNSEIEDELLAKMKELDTRLTKEKEDIALQMKRQSEEYEERLLSRQEEVKSKYEEEFKRLKDQVTGLEEIKSSYMKQVKQIEENNAEMHTKLSAVQVARDKALAEVKEANSRIEQINKTNEETQSSMTKEKESLVIKIKEQQIANEKLVERLKKEEEKKRELDERLTQVGKGSENIRQELTDTRADKEQISKQLEQVKQSKDALEKELKSLREAKEKISQELQKINTSSNEMSNNLTKQTKLCEELKVELDSTKKLNLGEESFKEEIKQLNSRIQTLQTGDSTKVDDRIRQLEDQLKQKEQEVAEKIAEAKRISEEDCQQQLKSLSLKYEKQSGGLQTDLIENNANNNDAKGISEEGQVLISVVEGVWRERVLEREGKMKREREALQKEWQKERAELERLTGVATAAFRSGTDSVELLKAQVQQQRQELQQAKHQHQLEVSELKTLLDVKQRRKKLPVSDSVRLAAATLEDAAEFEYLKNVLYQFMLGKETQTLAKVLCAVVKFDKQQQMEIAAFQQQAAALSAAEKEKELEAA